MPGELMIRVYPKRDSLTKAGRKGPGVGSQILLVIGQDLAAGPADPVEDWFSSPQLYRPVHWDFADSMKSRRNVNPSRLLGEEFICV